MTVLMMQMAREMNQRSLNSSCRNNRSTKLGQDPNQPQAAGKGVRLEHNQKEMKMDEQS